MTVIRPKFPLPPTPPLERAATKVKAQQALAQVKDGFQDVKPRPTIDPAQLDLRTRCFPGAGGVFDEAAEKIGEKIKDVLLPRPPIDPDVLEGAAYSFRLRGMSPKELFVEEAKQREILEDASTGPIQDAEAAAKAEKRLAAIEAERERRANVEDPRRIPGPLPLGAPVHTPDTELA